MKHTKKIVIIFVAAFCIAGVLLVVCQSVFTDPYIPRGYTSCKENREEIPWMDWTYYCWYQYDTESDISLPSAYRQVTAADILHIKGYFDNTRDWLEVSERLEEYDFDPLCISESDCWLLITDDDGRSKYADYQLYFFDKESARLYYLNNNT